MVRLTILCLLISSALSSTFPAGPCASVDLPLRATFANPGPHERILKIIHSWPDQPDAQDSLIRQLKSQGFGGVVCNVSFTDYLTSEPRWQAFDRAVHEAKKHGMALWMYDEKGYPSGSAGGLTLKGHPELEAQGLLIQDREMDGGALKMDIPPGRLMLSVAYPIRNGKISLRGVVDLKSMAAQGKINGALPPDRWRVMAITESRLYEGTHAQMSLGDHLPYINLLDRAATTRLLQLTHDQYAQRLTPNIGKFFDATFTDEPSLMSMFLRPMPYRVLPWSRGLAGEFRKRRGQPLEPLLPLLVADGGPESARARYEFWQTVGELVSENYFGQIQSWGRSHGVPSGGHLLMEESLLAHVSLYGDFFQCVRRLDAPSIDCLTSVPAEVPWQIAKLIGSAADIEGRPLRMCETSDFGQVYRPAEDKRPVRQVTEDEIRGTCNRLMGNGINTITSYYSFRGLSDEQLRRLNDWVGRSSTLLKGGHEVTDIAMLYPIESVWPRFTPARNGPTDSPTAPEVENAFRAAADSLHGAGRDFSYIDSRTLAQASAADGALTFRELKWRVLVLPSVDTLPLSAWRNVLRFWRRGGVVVALGARPANSELEFPSPEVRQIGDELFGRSGEAHVNVGRAGGVGVWLPGGTESLLPSAIDAVIEHDVTSVDGTRIQSAHRRIAGHDVYNVYNDSSSPWSGTLSFRGVGRGERWDPATGQVSALPSNGPSNVALSAYGAVFFRFNGATAPPRKKAAAGALPGLRIDPLPRVEPISGAGGFVQPNVAKIGDAWRAKAILTKGGVDTHHFLSFAYSSPLDLRGTAGISVRTSVPNGQLTGPNLIVIVREEDGGDYMAVTSRPLNRAGEVRSVIPWSQFQAAGWSNDPNGRLDIDRIAAINVGWGGYFGTEGQKVEFVTHAPDAFRLPGSTRAGISSPK